MPKCRCSVGVVPEKILILRLVTLPDPSLGGYCVPILIYSSPARKISILWSVVLPDLNLGGYYIDVSHEIL